MNSLPPGQSMSTRLNRRQALKTIAAASTAAILPRRMTAETATQQVAGRDVEIQITVVGPHAFRFSALPIERGKPTFIPDDGSLVRSDWGTPLLTLRENFKKQTANCGKIIVEIVPDPLEFMVTRNSGEFIQRIKINRANGIVSFPSRNSPLLGLGEGGPQFDRRGSTDEMRSGQGGYKLATHGGRVPIPWVIGTSGWAMFFHAPFGTFDFTGTDAIFQPPTAEEALPLDIFFIGANDPAIIMSEYARLTGNPELPPLWSLGYQQSHRTLASREAHLSGYRVLSVGLEH